MDLKKENPGTVFRVKWQYYSARHYEWFVLGTTDGAPNVYRVTNANKSDPSIIYETLELGKSWVLLKRPIQEDQAVFPIAQASMVLAYPYFPFYHELAGHDPREDFHAERLDIIFPGKVSRLKNQSHEQVARIVHPTEISS
jgi:hypothetical protein